MLNLAVCDWPWQLVRAEIRLPRGWQLLPLFLYFPLGIVLCILRIFIGINALIAACILPRMSLMRSYILRTMCLILGIVVQEENTEEKNRAAKLIISNHVSIIDHLALDLVLPCIMPSMWDLPQIINWCLGYKDFAGKRGRGILIENIKKHLNGINVIYSIITVLLYVIFLCISESVCSVLIHPEGLITNGSVGLLKFSSWPFSLARTINPIALRLNRPSPFPIPASVAGSRWYADLFWFFFIPFTIFTVRYLPEDTKDEDEDEQDTANRVQETIAAELKLRATSLSTSDILEYIKRNLTPIQTTVQRNSITTFSNENSELLRMAQQVKEVLPNVPLEVIRRDLLRTRNVDLTITNILEGLVPFVPETSQEQMTFVDSNSSQPESSINDGFSGSPGLQPQSCATTSDNSNVSFSSAVSIGRKSILNATIFSLWWFQASDFSTAASSFGKSAEERMMSFQERKQQLIEHARKLYIEKHQ
uniref:Lipid droplet-regulating VLDL assembly factor AUP1 n=1 Tax=Strigamia maritima TaxID=126957 RepID=T1IIU4_STRMM